MSDSALVLALAEFEFDPLGFVHWAFPWGDEETILAKAAGPEAWQRDILIHIGKALEAQEMTLGQSISYAVQTATASGHGVGKSCLVSWIILWAIGTKTNTRGVVTANTETQLKTKTWAELGKWYNLWIARDLFKLSATSIFSSDREHERVWRIDQIPWSERNTEAFAGLHNQGSRILVVFDEASAIPDIIWETTEGALTDSDTQIVWAVFGNPTRNSGRFKSCFDPQTFWHCTRVDSRNVSFTNKAQINRWIQAYGIDSDFVRIRILGQFPKQGEFEFFQAGEVDEAMVREVTPFGALALGVDVARFGANFSVLFPRRGRDARTIARRRFQGIDTVSLAQKVQDASREWRADGIFIDGGGVGGGVVDQVRHLQLHCFDVQFGGKANPSAEWNTLGEKYANKRAEMYGSVRAWMRTGAIPNDPDLRRQLLSITYTFNNRDEIILTSKEVMMREGKESPDDLDALALTFAMSVEAKPVRFGGYPIAADRPVGEYHPYDQLKDDYNPMDFAA